MMLNMLNCFPKALGQIIALVSCPFLIYLVRLWSQFPGKRKPRSSTALEVRVMAALGGKGNWKWAWGSVWGLVMLHF